MTITWNTDVNAPCCPGEIVNDDGRNILVQTDWDYPSVASSFGWSVNHAQKCQACGHVQPKRGYVCEECESGAAYCDHDSTDGTIDCPDCGLTAGDFITAAGEWLRDNGGLTADDPGYFE